MITRLLILAALLVPLGGCAIIDPIGNNPCMLDESCTCKNDITMCPWDQGNHQVPNVIQRGVHHQKAHQ
jgi:hypothetical protein